MNNDITANVTGVQRQTRGVVKPTSVQEVRDIVLQARRDGVPLYPISTGLNWGYGSRAPVTDDNRVVDLSGMNRILNADEISVDNPVAVIEPGVTQAQLFRFLQEHCPELSFNVTGSGKDTSLLGCALDRGVGYFGPRYEDVFGLEAVLGTGEVLKTGFRRLGEQSPLAHAHPHGLGPILDGLFFQGNAGIVTSACLQLRPRRPREVAVSLSLRRTEDLGELINVLARLKRDGLLTSVTHIGNKARNQSTLMHGITDYLIESCALTPEKARTEAEHALDMLAPYEWSSLAAVTGNRGQVRAAVREIRRRTNRLARLVVLTEGMLSLGQAVLKPLRFLPKARASAAAIHAMRPLHRLALGEPTDVPIQNLLWKFGHPNRRAQELDASRCGLLFVNPALPLDGALAAKTVAGMEAVAREYDHVIYMTLNIETPTSMVAVINLLFDRTNAEEVERAHACADALLEHMIQAGLSPYRARADMMNQLISADDPYWNNVRSIKGVVDPDNIIAPGRYSPL
ncbi:FAD-binding oxidoreductase [Thioalkalivibrio sp. ALJ24]|uniref:FAD-binding oxidoreductase n=1 Tax=Thioalkalivibrio sp. ALJ24 TaxID=545276 RepID=UPI00036279DE|nr:FAD-binding protein [Thioalkalivibrio sp. ALJ24]